MSQRRGAKSELERVVIGDETAYEPDVLVSPILLGGVSGYTRRFYQKRNNRGDIPLVHQDQKPNIPQN